MIAQARERMVAAEQRVQELEDLITRTKEEANEWAMFIRRAEILMSGEQSNGAASEKSEVQASEVIVRRPDHAHEAEQQVRVKRDSLPGHAAKLIKEKGPMSLRELVDAMTADGVLRGKRPDAVLNSALWRREDLFERKDKKYHLRTLEYELVE
jgi:hypothetical protein